MPEQSFYTVIHNIRQVDDAVAGLVEIKVTEKKLSIRGRLFAITNSGSSLLARRRCPLGN